jgi:Reverse transcriptase (RNA-dependent DNA polymerase)
VPQGSVLGSQGFIAYIDFLACLIHRHELGHQIYADDAQLIGSARLAENNLSIDRMQQCVEEIHRRCASWRLQLNPSKTEVIWYGSKTTLKKILDMDLALRFGTDVIQPAKVVRDLDVLLDQELTMKQHISKVTRTCFSTCAVRNRFVAYSVQE